MDISGYALETLREDAKLILFRARRTGHPPFLMLAPSKAEQETEVRQLLQRELALAHDLDGAWAVRPLSLERHRESTVLVLADTGGDLLEAILDGPLELSRFLEIAIGLAATLREVHGRHLVHKDFNPANVLIDAEGRVRLAGFGVAASLSESSSKALPDVVGGSLSYSSPEQTGRLNRKVDTRSDLYSLGVTMYQMITGTLPFVTTDPLELVHCHVARQPQPPHERNPEIPLPIECIILKLLAKSPEDRYQTAAGLEYDLRLCREALLKQGRIDEFPIGSRDHPDRLTPPEKLYGRAEQVEALIRAFDRVSESGDTRLVLISGFAGVGKTALVTEFQKHHVDPRGLFAAGKADQHTRTTPYAALSAAIQMLVREVLGKDAEALRTWRKVLLGALGPNGRLMVELVPELSLIVGAQPPVPILSPKDEKRRIQLLLKGFLAAFAQPERPLTLFLDDLQWGDSSTLEFIKLVAADRDIKNLLIVGAYRYNEIASSHPLSGLFMTADTGSAETVRIFLAPLDIVDVKHLVADALRCGGESSASLAELVLEKTGGNPFFVVQSLTAMAAEGLLIFDPRRSTWLWNTEAIRATAISENVADLLTTKLKRLPRITLEILKQLACLGGRSSNETLRAVRSDLTPEAIQAALSIAMEKGLIVYSEHSYRFVHDRVQEAAYALIPEAACPAEHLRTGRAMLSTTPDSELGEQVFELAYHLNRGAGLISSQKERVRVAELNLVASRRARMSAAYPAALNYLAMGIELLGGHSWRDHYRLVFDLEILRAECEFLTGDIERAAARLRDLSKRASNLVDRGSVTCLQITIHATASHLHSAVLVGLEFLESVGIAWSPDPEDVAVQRELERTQALLSHREIEDLIDLPIMHDPEHLAIISVLAELMAPALLYNYNLYDLVILRMTNLSIQHGNCAASSFAYSMLNLVLGLRLGDYQSGHRFGQLGCDLVDKRGLVQFKARVYMGFGKHVLPWTRPLAVSREWLKKAIDLSIAAGDLTYEGYSRIGLTGNFMLSGEPLANAERETEAALAWARKAQFMVAVDAFIEELLLIRELRGDGSDEKLFGGLAASRGAFEKHLEEHRAIWPGISARYWIHRIQACFMKDAVEGSLVAETKVRPVLWTARDKAHIIEYYFYSALSLARAFDTASPEQRREYLDTIHSHHRQMASWRAACAANYAHRESLIAAELARLEARDLDAQRLYEKSINLARNGGYVPHEGIAHELAARFYAARGFDTIAETYLRNAHSCYLRWGADGKVRQLEQQHSYLRAHSLVNTSATPAARIDRLDIAAVVKMSQALSGELVLGELVNRLMTIVVEYAGAVRGLLFLSHDADVTVVAEATSNRDTVVVNQLNPSGARRDFPVSILNYVARTHQSVIVDNVAERHAYSSDDYVSRLGLGSLLCLPLSKQGQLVGVLYLENTLSPNVFTAERTSVLNILAAQAAISIENAILYRNLQETQELARRAERELRSSFDMIPALAWRTSADGRIEFANKQWHDFTGISEETPTRKAWLSTFHPDDQSKVSMKWSELLRDGAAGKFEARMSAFDGTIRTFLIRASPMRDERGDIVKWYGTSTDIDDLKRAEEAQEALARASRLASMGELTVSIAHEVSQPLVAITANAGACIRWLSDDQLNIKEAREAAEDIVKSGHRAGEILSSIRRLARKSPSAMMTVDIHELINDVLALMHGELNRRGVIAETVFASGIGLAIGDRVKLQQVVLNLIMNGCEAMGTIVDRPRRLQIFTEREEAGYIVVRVADSGEGLDPAKIDKVFDAFFTTKPEGLGMGLSICRSIVQAHGGRLWASPNAPHGSVFHFNVPTHTEDEMLGRSL